MRNTGNEFIAFITGMAAGAGIAVLLAPQSGTRTRRQIRRKAEDVQDSLEDISDNLAERGRELVDRGRETASQTVKDFGRRARATVG
jgi:gas vesicle protein